MPCARAIARTARWRSRNRPRSPKAIDATPKRERSIRCVVSGRVQGVYYRAATFDRATELGLKGWVRNLPDRRVEVVAAGDIDTVGALAVWLWEGPPAARVDQVAIEEWNGVLPEGFSIR